VLVEKAHDFFIAIQLLFWPEKNTFLNAQSHNNLVAVVAHDVVANDVVVVV